MEAKGQQRSNIVNYATWLSNLVRSTADASLGFMGTFMEVKGKQRSNIGEWSVATKFSQKICWYKFRMIMTFTEVKGQQRS